MKKRFLCLMLTLIMLVSLVPVTAISASAASLSTSSKAITVLKKMTTFRDKCYRVADTQDFRIGYGTVCSGKHEVKADGTLGHTPHTITEKKADEALRELLKEMDKKVNSFASSNGLNLKQNQHDALVVFSYNVGTAWMNGNGAVKTAIVSGANVNELLKAFATVENSMERRLIEANMYVHGVYSNVVPDTFSTVSYNSGRGSMMPHDADNVGRYTNMYFDVTQTVAHPVTVTAGGFTFLGWYTAFEGGQRVPNLTGDCAGKTLYGVWQSSMSKDDDPNLWQDVPSVSYTFKISQLPSLELRDNPNGRVSSSGSEWLKKQTQVKIRAEYMDAKGVRWGYVDGRNGWVVMPGSSAAAGGSNSNGEIDVTVTVTNSYVNSRKNATIFSAKNGSYSQGAKLRIINTASADGFLWGQIAKSADDNTPIGWIALMYTNWNSVKDGGSGSNGSANNTKAIATATVTYNGYLNLRSGAGMDNRIVGSLYRNEIVDIFEIKTVDGHQWGRANAGWLCLTYTSLTMLGNNKNDMVSNEGALAYVFTGDFNADLLTGGFDYPHVSPTIYADLIQTEYTFEDSNKVKHTVNLLPKPGEDITISNKVIDSDGKLWVKFGWRVDLDDNGVDDTTKYGWVYMRDDMKRTPAEADLSLDSLPVSMDPVKFTVVADELTVRQAPSSGAAPVGNNIKLNKGVEIQINAIKLVGEDMWGYLTNEYVTKGSSIDYSGYGVFDGWVNLASKYVSRTNLPTIEGDTSLTPTGKIATIVGSDNVNVRITGSTSGKRIGSLKRGTTANVLETSKNGDWYNLDVDVDNNPATGSWVYKQYVEISDGTIGGGSNGGSGNAPAPVITGKGVVANTYAGVNVREGAGQGYKQVGKLLPGTIVDVLEIKQGGAAKWARIAQGWVCMDYITMLSQETVYPEGTPDKDGSTVVGSYEEIDRTTTTAVYTGKIPAGTPIYANTEHHGASPDDQGPSHAVRVTSGEENITIYELIAVQEIRYEGKDEHEGEDDPNRGHGTDVEIVETSYWARINDGYIYNPQDTIDLYPLDEKVHTVTGSDTLNVRQTPEGELLAEKSQLKKGEQVKVTSLDIIRDKVWGRIEFEGEIGWIRLDYTSEGAYKVQEKPQQPETPAPSEPIIGAPGNNGGFVTNGKGYRYTGKVINTNQVNVRAMPNTTSKVTTTLKSGASLVIYETQTAENMAWGRCDAGWVYLYYVDLTPVTGNGAVDARVVANNKAGIIYSDSTGSDTVGTYAGMSVIDIYEIVNGRARTDLGWITTDDLL